MAYSQPPVGLVDGSSAGPVYATSIAVIALSVPMTYLPIYQR